MKGGRSPLLSSYPDWASHSLGIFICLNCSGIHRNIPQVSKVKSVRLDDWDDAQVEFMASNGNNVAKAKYESKMPPFYYKPTFLDCQRLLLTTALGGVDNTSLLGLCKPG
ncbi:hypothetical protein llap_17384 [Limosa lapponica baueri]|uniref:Arf-GAP domain-containing protein n=1 Tax=Limosa lapponica baueri TaxID=1758121 RepID=A0A2I0TEW0_LIMLA|nr:hypothetical protein llap_17384 [Limosa lapponica baueri]